MKYPADIAKFMESYGVDDSEVWEVRSRTYAVKHKALERIAVGMEITFDPPQVISCDMGEKLMVVCVTGHFGARTEWSLGEAAPYNNKNNYPAAMAEKRAKDRVILKLLGTHGALFSESEADEFVEPERENPHVNRPEDITDLPAEDSEDFFPAANDGIKPLPKKDARPIAEKLGLELNALKSQKECRAWRASNIGRVATLPDDWRLIFSGRYKEHRLSLPVDEAHL